MSKATTIKLQKYLKANRRKKDEIICTIDRLAEYMGVSHQYPYNRFKDHKWSDTDRFALSKLMPEKSCIILESTQLTKSIFEFLEEQKIERRKGYVTVGQVAKKLNI